MKRDKVLQIIESARSEDNRPDLQGANLRGADLIRADLHGVNLRGAKYNEQTKWPEGFVITPNAMLYID